MISMTTREDLAHFLSDPENAQGLNFLVEDIRYALMDYQVRALDPLVLTASNVYARLRYDETSTTRAANKS